jgi:proline dehydrogenase
VDHNAPSSNNIGLALLYGRQAANAISGVVQKEEFCHDSHTMSNPMPDFQNTEIAFKHQTDADLNRARILFRAINIKPLVVIGPSMVTGALKLGLPISGLLRWTVFRQFCGGETLPECKATLDRLKQLGVFSILDYGVEGEKSEAGYDATVKEVLHSIAVTKSQSSAPFCVFKVSAVARFELLEKISSVGIDKLDSESTAEWRAAEQRVDKICDAAINAGKLVMIDAEETWIQSAIDHLALTMMRKHNKTRPQIYTTIQMYRTDGLSTVKTLLANARKENWTPAIKLVRGAYLEKERERAANHGYASPIHPDKASTDTAYDQALSLILSERENAVLCAGTHNAKSSKTVVKLMDQLSLPPKSPRVWFAQLLGMSDDLTFNLAHAGYLAAKYVPYGPLAAVLPYLFRRARENTSIAGQSGRELQLIESELKRRSKL